MPTIDDVLPPLEPAVDARLVALCDGVDVCMAALADLERCAIPAFLQATAVQHVVNRGPQGGFAIERRDHFPSPDGMTAHAQLALATFLDALHGTLGTLDGLFLELADCLARHAPGFRGAVHIPSLALELWKNGRTNRLFLRSTPYSARKAMEARVDQDSELRSLKPGELLRMCRLACRAKGACSGPRWTFGWNIMHSVSTRFETSAEDPASALAWIAATQNHNALDGQTGIVSLVRHESAVSELMYALAH